MQSVGRGLTAAIHFAYTSCGAASVKMASDYNESLNKVDVSFKGSSAQVKEFAKTSLEKALVLLPVLLWISRLMVTWVLLWV
jgi:hypothetical protein